MNETVTRLLTAAVVAPLTIWMLSSGGFWWTAYVGLAAVICELEFFAIMEAKGFAPHRAITVAISLALLVVSYIAGFELGAAMLTFGILALLVMQLYRPIQGTAINNLSVSLAAILYIPWLLSHGIHLRELSGADGRVDLGVFHVLFVLCCTFGADTGGYFAGRRFGRHLVAPRVSPKKTWEGLIGGLVAAGFFGLVYTLITERFFHAVPYIVSIDAAGWAWLGYVPLFVFGMVLGLVGFFGDLVESMLKRDASVKDSGSLLPGHGGMLDRVDGVLFTIPFAYYVFTLYERFFH